MDLVYVDDSRDEALCIFSALVIPSEHWRRAFDTIKGFRRKLKVSDGIYVYKEFHATEFTRGKGQIADRVVPKGRRRQIFKDTLRLVTDLPHAQLMNAAFPHKDDERAFEFLLNRINKGAQVDDSQALLICDDGKQEAYTKLARRMSVFNYIPSRYGLWEEVGASKKHIPTERIIEDPVFKDSRQSYFIQLVDFCAFAPLRYLRPTSIAERYGVDQSFLLLEPILVKEACQKDPLGLGIIRP